MTSLAAGRRSGATIPPDGREEERPEDLLRAAPPDEPAAERFPAAPDTSRVVANPLEREDLLRMYTPGAVGAAIGLAAVLSGLPWILNRIGAILDGGVADAARALPWGWPAGVVWALCLLHVPALVLTRRALLAGRAAAFRRNYWVQSLIQLLWVQALAWLTLDRFPSFGVATLFALLMGWAFNDARFFYDTRSLRLQYVVAFPLFDALLVAFDLAVRHGFAPGTPAGPRLLWEWLALQALFLVTTQAIVRMVGQDAYAHDRMLLAQSRLDRERALLVREREVLQQSSSFLVNGLAAAQFCHDVAGRVGSARLNLDVVLKALSAQADRGALPGGRPVAEALTDLDADVRAIQSMTLQVIRSVQGADPLSPAPVSVLVEQAIASMRHGLRSSCSQVAEPVVFLEAADVYVADVHVASLGNILANGAVRQPARPLEIRGRRVGPFFYRLTIRDHGVSGARQREALAKVHRILSLSRTAAPLDSGAAEALARRERGFGIALLIAKVLFVRYNGWLAATLPEHGDGLEFHVVLPVEDPRRIPAEANHPEQVAIRPLAGGFGRKPTWGELV